MRLRVAYPNFCSSLLAEVGRVVECARSRACERARGTGAETRVACASHCHRTLRAVTAHDAPAACACCVAADPVCVVRCTAAARAGPEARTAARALPLVPRPSRKSRRPSRLTTRRPRQRASLALCAPAPQRGRIRECVGPRESEQRGRFTRRVGVARTRKWPGRARSTSRRKSRLACRMYARLPPPPA